MRFRHRGLLFPERGLVSTEPGALQALSISTDYDGVGDFAATDGAEPVTRPRA
jgi:hypothetical protein